MNRLGDKFGQEHVATGIVAAILLAAIVAGGGGALANRSAAPSTTAPASSPTVALVEIKAAIRDLGGSTFAVRERATQLLWQAGEAARDDLEAAAESDNPETASRAKTLLERLRYDSGRLSSTRITAR